MNNRKRQQRRAADMMIRSKRCKRFTFDDLSDALSQVSESLTRAEAALVNFAHAVAHFTTISRKRKMLKTTNTIQHNQLT